MLNKVIKGKIQSPHFVLIYGTDSVGKSTFGASAPNPIFLEMESGSDNLDVSRLKIKSFEELNQALNSLLTEEHDFKSVVVDSLDWLEPLVWAAVCQEGGQKSIEDFGYGKGYVLALKKWNDLILTFKKLREVKKMNIILIAHSQIKVFNDPSQPQSYDRYQLKLNDKAAALFREAVDSVLFATFETFVKKDGNMSKAKAFGEGKRVLFTERRPSFDAKNRFGLPFELPLNWDAYVSAKNDSKPDNLKMIRQDIEDLIATCEKLDKKELMQKAYIQAGDNIEKLNEVLNRIKVTLTK